MDKLKVLNFKAEQIEIYLLRQYAELIELRTQIITEITLNKLNIQIGDMITWEEYDELKGGEVLGVDIVLRDVKGLILKKVLPQKQKGGNVKVKCNVSFFDSIKKV